MSEQGRPRRTASEWSELIERQGESGLSQRDFCDAEGLAVSTFTYWKRKLSGAPVAKPRLEALPVNLISNSQSSAFCVRKPDRYCRIRSSNAARGGDSLRKRRSLSSKSSIHSSAVRKAPGSAAKVCTQPRFLTGARRSIARGVKAWRRLSQVASRRIPMWLASKSCSARTIDCANVSMSLKVWCRCKKSCTPSSRPTRTSARDERA